MDDFVIINGVLIRYDGNDQDIVIPDSVQRIGDPVCRTVWWNVWC